MKVLKSRVKRATGTGLQMFRPAGLIYNSVTSAGNVDTDETTIFTYTLPGGSLVNDGDTIRVNVRGDFASNGNTKTVKVHFGSTGTGSGSTWTTNFAMDFWITRTGDATQRMNGVLDIGSTGDGYMSEPTETLTGDVIVKFTGQSSAVSDDVTGLSFNVFYFPIT